MTVAEFRKKIEGLPDYANLQIHLVEQQVYSDFDVEILQGDHFPEHRMWCIALIPNGLPPD